MLGRPMNPLPPEPPAQRPSRQELPPPDALPVQPPSAPLPAAPLPSAQASPLPSEGQPSRLPVRPGRTSLGGLGFQIVEHWKEFRPKMYAQLVASGQLEQRAKLAQDRTLEALHELMDQGQSYPEAWEAVRELWAFLPSEEDQPELGTSPEG